MTGADASIPEISVPLKVGSRVTLFENVDIEDTASGYTAEPFFEGYVEQYVPDTGLLRFEDKSIGRADFRQLLYRADGIEILKA